MRLIKFSFGEKGAVVIKLVLCGTFFQQCAA
jgi:hypothetical protein